MSLDGQKGLFVTEDVTEDDVLPVYNGPVFDRPTRLPIQVVGREHIED